MKLHSTRLFLAGLILFVLWACSLETGFPTQTSTPAAVEQVSSPGVTDIQTDTPTVEPTVTNTPNPAIRFAVIGDYGSGTSDEGDVAALVKSWKPDFILTTGDNNYPIGAAESIDYNIGQFYGEFISPYHGYYGKGADKNRFFPTLGNHDWMTLAAQPYMDYFSLPGNERYYHFSWGLVDFLAVDSDSNEPDGVGSSSRQAQWLRDELTASQLPWKVVYFHQPPYSSGLHGSTDWSRWPYKDWGATVVLSGHDHLYERLEIDGFPYFINGAGGGGLYEFANILDGSQKRYNAEYGAMLVTADEMMMKLQFFNVENVLIDEYNIHK